MMSRTVYSFLGINKNINTSQNSNKINFADVIVILKKNKIISMGYGQLQRLKMAIMLLVKQNLRSNNI